MRRLSIEETIPGLEEFMTRKGFERIGQMRVLALNYLPKRK